MAPGSESKILVQQSKILVQQIFELAGTFGASKIGYFPSIFIFISGTSSGHSPKVVSKMAKSSSYFCVIKSQ